MISHQDFPYLLTDEGDCP